MTSRERRGPELSQEQIIQKHLDAWMKVRGKKKNTTVVTSARPTRSGRIEQWEVITPPENNK